MRRTVRVAIVALLLVLTACSGSSSSSRPCESGCTGTAAGTTYAIQTPAHWNGTLLLYSVGYIGVGGKLAPPRLTGTDGARAGSSGLANELLAQGYALAGTQHSSGGWSLASVVTDAQHAYDAFRQKVARPARVYAWGESMGGLATELISERYPWVTGAAPMCGVVAGPLRNFDNLAEAIQATQTLTGVPLLKNLGGGGAAATEHRLEQVLTAAAGSATGRAGIAYLATLLGLPDRATGVPAGAATATATAAAQVATIDDYVAFAEESIPELFSRYGANPTDSGGSVADRTTLAAAQDAARAAGADPAAFTRQVSAIPTVMGVARARAALAASGTPTGRLRVPTVTLHTRYDPIAIVANESAFRDEVAAQHGLGRLLQLYVGPAADGSGIGHCEFSISEMAGVVDVLNRWVTTGQQPGATRIRGDLGAGLLPGYRPPAWPAP